jgi:hypothetical protein
MSPPDVCTITLAGMQAAGIPLAALGIMRKGKQVVSGCFAFFPTRRDPYPKPRRRERYGGVGPQPNIDVLLS